MADVAINLGGSEFFISPKELTTDELYAVRLHDPDSEEEAQKVERLMESIDRDGQIDTIVITKDKQIISGHRRTRAAMLLNEKRARNSQPLFKVRVRVDSDGDLERKAIVANTQRLDLSPMDLARLIQRLREKHGWEGFKGAKKVADYLGVSPALVTQTEKLLSVGREVQDQVHAGELTAQAAIDMIGMAPEQQKEVLDRAREIQKEKDENLSDRAKSNRAKKAAAANEAAGESNGKGETAEVEPTTKIQRPAVVQAIREKNASTTVFPLNKKQILEILDEFDSPAYGYEDGAVRMFVRYFVDQIAAGKGTVGTLRKRFDAMVAKAPKGVKKPKPEPEPEPKKKAAAKKTPVKKTAKKKVAKKAAKKKAVEAETEEEAGE